VDKGFKILIADRNRNVRNLLQRELFDEGYRVTLAGEDRELLRLLHDEGTADLLILDPDIPSHVTVSELIKLVHSYRPKLPIIIYTFLSDEINYLDMPGVVICLEKGEDVSILRRVVADLINKYYQSRFSPS
jgi:DNA-binding NtrC family response regulator